MKRDRETRQTKAMLPIDAVLMFSSNLKAARREFTGTRNKAVAKWMFVAQDKKANMARYTTVFCHPKKTKAGKYKPLNRQDLDIYTSACCNPQQNDPADRHVGSRFCKSHAFLGGWLVGWLVFIHPLFPLLVQPVHLLASSFKLDATTQPAHLKQGATSKAGRKGGRERGRERKGVGGSQRSQREREKKKSETHRENRMERQREKTKSDRDTPGESERERITQRERARERDRESLRESERETEREN